MTNRIHSLIYRLKPRALSIAIGLTLFAHVPAYADSNYGPIAPGETLSKIVNENYLVSQYSDAIIMREIFRLNPESFINNDMGLLKQGVELILPDDNSIRRSVPSASVRALVSPTPVVRSNNRLVTVQESLKIVRDERDGLKLDLSRTRSELSELKVRFESTQNELSALTQKAKDTASIAAPVASAQNDSAIAVLEESLNKIRSEREAVTAQLADAEAKFDSLKVKYDAATASSTDEELAVKLEAVSVVETELRADLEAALAVGANLKSELESSSVVESSLRGELETVLASGSDLEKKVESLSLSESNLKTKLEAALLVESDLKSKLETALSVESDLLTKLEVANKALVESEKSALDAKQAVGALKQGSSQQSVALIEAELTKQNLAKSSRQIEEKDKKIAELELSIDDLTKQLETAATGETVLAEAGTTNNNNAADSDKVISDLNQQITAYQEEVKELQSQNDELVNDLMSASAPLDDLDVSMGVDPLLADAGPVIGVGDSVAVESNTSFLTKSIQLPTWSALLWLLGLGLAGLMVILGRRNKSLQAVVTNDTATSDDLVFKSGNLSADLDVDALRVPPRRDPSRVAILDPSMTGELPSVASSAKSAVTTASSQSDSYDADLKLAMAEAYMELSDMQAANELLHEVLLEGSTQQQSSAELLMSRLVG